MNALTDRNSYTLNHTKKRSRLTIRCSLVAALLLAPFTTPSIAQQAAAEPIQVQGYHNFGLRVSDVERSLEFYQGLFGSTVVSRVGDKVSLQVGDGPQYFTLEPTRGGEQPHISYFGLSVASSNRYNLQNQLGRHGLSRTVDSMGKPVSALNRAMHSWLERLPGGEDDTMLADNHELFAADRDGVVFQLTDINACGTGDDECVPEAAPAPGLIRLQEINHMTTYVSNFELSNDFYRKLFGIENKVFQGTFPILGVNDGNQFLMFVGGTQPGTPTQPGRIDHVSFNIEDFTEESVLQRLTDYGLSARAEGENAPLQHWVSRRMPDRGGIPGGTPEVYFSDPDGIHIQLQHHTYCGGGNEFGGDCGQ